MQNNISIVNVRGRVTIPVEIRRHLGLNAHDKVAFVIAADGTVRLQPLRNTSIARLRAMAGRLNRSVTWEQMRRIAYEDRFHVVGEQEP